MKEQTLKAKIMQFIAAIGFKLFIWGNQTTTEKYWQEIWEQENSHRAKHFPEQPEEQSVLRVEGMTEMEHHFFEIHQNFNPGLSDMELLKSFYNQFPSIKKRMEARKSGGVEETILNAKFPPLPDFDNSAKECNINPNAEKARATRAMYQLDDDVWVYEGDEVYCMLKNKFGYFKNPKLEIAGDHLFGSETLPAICTEAVFFSDKKAAKEHKTLHNRKINEAYLKSQESNG